MQWCSGQNLPKYLTTKWQDKAPAGLELDNMQLGSL